MVTANGNGNSREIENTNNRHYSFVSSRRGSDARPETHSLLSTTEKYTKSQISALDSEDDEACHRESCFVQEYGLRTSRNTKSSAADSSCYKVDMKSGNLSDNYERLNAQDGSSGENLSLSNRADHKAQITEAEQVLPAFDSAKGHL